MLGWLLPKHSCCCDGTGVYIEPQGQGLCIQCRGTYTQEQYDAYQQYRRELREACERAEAERKAKEEAEAKKIADALKLSDALERSNWDCEKSPVEVCCYTPEIGYNCCIFCGEPKWRNESNA